MYFMETPASEFREVLEAASRYQTEIDLAAATRLEERISDLEGGTVPVPTDEDLVAARYVGGTALIFGTQPGIVVRPGDIVRVRQRDLERTDLEPVEPQAPTEDAPHEEEIP